MQEMAQMAGVEDPKRTLPEALAAHAHRFDGALSAEQIEAEKAAKPRADLIPFTAVAEMAQRLPMICVNVPDPSVEELVLRAWEDLAEYAKAPSTATLAVAGVHLAMAIAAIDGAPKRKALPHACMQAGHVMGYGRRKHGRCTWRAPNTEQADPETHVASAARHCIEYLIDAAAVEPGSKRPVLWHAFAQTTIAIDCREDPAT